MLSKEALSARADLFNEELKRHGLTIARSLRRCGDSPAGTMILGKRGRPDRLVAGDGVRSLEQIVASFLLAEQPQDVGRVVGRLDEVFDL